MKHFSFANSFPFYWKKTLASYLYSFSFSFILIPFDKDYCQSPVILIASLFWEFFQIIIRGIHILGSVDVYFFTLFCILTTTWDTGPALMFPGNCDSVFFSGSRLRCVVLDDYSIYLRRIPQSLVIKFSINEKDI